MCKTIYKKITTCYDSQKVRLTILFNLILHIFDITTDINVTIGLKNENSEYFYTSFGILLFSFTASALLSLQDEEFKEYTLEQEDFIRDYKNYCDDDWQQCKNDVMFCKNTVILFFKAFKWMILDIVQYKYIKNSVLYIITNQISLDEYNKLNDKRIKEALLESGPEALFQLFIILNKSNNKTYLELITYYLSVKMSLLSLTNTLISYEIDTLKTINWLGIRTQIPFKHLDNISYNSVYIKNIIIFRLTEIFSNTGLLACISQVYNGYYLFSFILLDYILLNILNLIKRILRFKVEDCKFSDSAIRAMKNSKYVVELIKFKDTMSSNSSRISIKYNDSISNINFNVCKIQLAWRLYKCNKVKKIFETTTTLKNNKKIHIDWVNYEKNTKEMLKKEKKILFHGCFGFSNQIHGIEYLLNNIKQLGVYSNALSLRIVKEIKRERNKKFFNDLDIYFKLPNDKYWWNKISMHFIAKYLTHLIISILLIHNLTIENQSTTIIVISISSICCFIINMFSLYKITTLITQYINKCDEDIFISKSNFKFNCICLNKN